MIPAKCRDSARTRRIWAQHNGPIPVDENGISFDIHHRDGDWRNNSPDNLQALSVADHYRVHFAQGDWGAAWYIAQRIKLSAEDYEAIREKISAALKGRKMSVEWRKKISAALTGRKSDPAAVEKIRLANTGRKYGPEYGQKITERQLGTKATEEARRNMSAARRGKKASAETRLKMSTARKGQYRDPDATRRMVETRRANGSYGKKS
jgi:hypothetical protein